MFLWQFLVIDRFYYEIFFAIFVTAIRVVLQPRDRICLHFVRASAYFEQRTLPTPLCSRADGNREHHSVPTTARRLSSTNHPAGRKRLWCGRQYWPSQCQTALADFWEPRDSSSFRTLTIHEIQHALSWFEVSKKLRHSYHMEHTILEILKIEEKNKTRRLLWYIFPNFTAKSC